MRETATICPRCFTDEGRKYLHSELHEEITRLSTALQQAERERDMATHALCEPCDNHRKFYLLTMADSQKMVEALRSRLTTVEREREDADGRLDDRLRTWYATTPRPPAQTAFTAGGLRQTASLMETLDARCRHLEKAQEEITCLLSVSRDRCAALQADLKMYGRHLPACVNRTLPECDCGFTAAQERGG